MAGKTRNALAWGLGTIAALSLATVAYKQIDTNEQVEQSEVKADQSDTARVTLAEQIKAACAAGDVSVADLCQRAQAEPPQGAPLAGPTGPMGPRGFTGDTGPVGAMGQNGPKGDVGAEGRQGMPGADSKVPGPTGPAGADGADSTVPGPTGPGGAPGEMGPAGAGIEWTSYEFDFAAGTCTVLVKYTDDAEPTSESCTMTGNAPLLGR